MSGVTFKPNADVAIKFDYVFNRNASSVVRPLERHSILDLDGGSDEILTCSR